MNYPEEWGPDGGGGTLGESKLVPMSLSSNESLFVKTLLVRSCPGAKLVQVQRIQNKKLWGAYARCRDDELATSCLGGEVNELLLFHGTGERSAAAVLSPAGA